MASVLQCLVEPPELLTHFLAHPPEGFVARCSPAGAPLFLAPLNLLTTVDDALKQRVARWPGYALWGRALSLRSGFVGSTVTEYAPLPALPAEALAADLEAAAQDPALRGHRLLIVKDLPQDSPLLGATDNAAARALAEALRARGFVLLEGQALAWLPIDFDSLDDYLARLSSGRRRDIRRKLRVRADLQIECIETGAPALDDDALRATLYRLYEQVYAQSLTQFDRLTPAFFDAVLRDKRLPGRLFLYRRDGRLIGWNLCLVHDGALVDKYIGLDYPAAREHNLYVVSWIVNLEYALAHGLTRYVAGWTDPQIKAALGARFAFTRHAVRPRNALLRAALRRLAPLFEGDRAWQARDRASRSP